MSAQIGQEAFQVPHWPEQSEWRMAIAGNTGSHLGHFEGGGDNHGGDDGGRTEWIGHDVLVLLKTSKRRFAKRLLPPSRTSFTRAAELAQSAEMQRQTENVLL